MSRTYYRACPLTGAVQTSSVPFESEPSRLPVVSDSYMEGTTSPVDGSLIDTRGKRREHMRVHGLADADDFKGEWRQAAERRASPTGTPEQKARLRAQLREALARGGR